MDKRIQEILRDLPSVDEVLRAVSTGELGHSPRWALVQAVREQIDELRNRIIKEGVSGGEIDKVNLAIRIKELIRPSLRPVLNATGVVLHTNLGRAPLGYKVIERMAKVASGYSNLEYELDKRCRGSRHVHVRDLICRITGAQDAVVVNNNAACVLLGVTAFAAQKEVVVSRGELVEIGGSFRLPDVVSVSGALMREVGTTNRTHVRDYEQAICERTGLLLKVHRSNFSQIGFTAELSMSEIVDLGKRYNVPTMFDLGSGTLMDLSLLGLPDEPTVQEVVKAGFDLVTFSGDKLLGGPQAGIAVGKTFAVEKLRSHPMMRAMRPCKLTLSALTATLEFYQDETALKEIPSLAMLSVDVESLHQRANHVASLLKESLKEPWLFEVISLIGRTGGGSLPNANVKSCGVAITHPKMNADAVESLLRNADPPIIARIEKDKLVLDMRTIPEDKLEVLVRSVKEALV